MARTNLPSHLALKYGKKNWTKAEIKEKQMTEVIMSGDNIQPSKHLTKKQKEQFNWYVEQFKEDGILANVDSNALSRYVMLNDEYWKLTKTLKKLDMLDAQYEKVYKLRTSCSTQLITLEKELGLTLVSRSKIRKDKNKKEEAKEKTTAERLFLDKLG